MIIGRKSVRRAGQNMHDDALDDKKVRRNSLLRSFERTGGLNPSTKAEASGQKTWSNGKSALLVRVPAQLGAPLSVYLAEFLGFARLRPRTPGRAAHTGDLLWHFFCLEPGVWPLSHHVPITGGYCWRTRKCRNLCFPHAFLEGKKAWETSARKGTARTLK